MSLVIVCIRVQHLFGFKGRLMGLDSRPLEEVERFEDLAWLSGRHFGKSCHWQDVSDFMVE